MRFRSVLAVAFVGLLAWSGVVAAYVVTRHDPTPLYRFCAGRLERVAIVTPCEDGSLRMVA